MVLTRDFKDTIKDRVARDTAFREELLKEGIECLLTGDEKEGQSLNSELSIETQATNLLSKLYEQSLAH